RLAWQQAVRRRELRPLPHREESVPRIQRLLPRGGADERAVAVGHRLGDRGAGGGVRVLLASGNEVRPWLAGLHLTVLSPPSSSMTCTSSTACTARAATRARSEEHTSELQSLAYLVC